MIEKKTTEINTVSSYRNKKKRLAVKKERMCVCVTETFFLLKYKLIFDITLLKIYRYE